MPLKLPNNTSSTMATNNQQFAHTTPTINPYISQPYGIPKVDGHQQQQSEFVKPVENKSLINSGGVKRDFNGSIIKQVKTIPTTAAAAATAVAAASVDMDNKAKKARDKEAKDKKKKVIRSAAGQTWEGKRNIIYYVFRKNDSKLRNLYW